MRAKSGFTLVEILIVVVILGILAAIVIPQFTDASTEAKTSSLCSDLQTVRSQLELYKIQHNDALPQPEAGGATWTRMTQYTDIDGTVVVGDVALGDLNFDGTVDIFDIIILGGAFGSEPGNPRWNPDADINNDDIIDIYDAIILAGNFQKTI